MHHGRITFFLLVIVSREAHLDEQRAAILEPIDRTEKAKKGRSFRQVKADRQAVWPQYDLHADDNLVINDFHTTGAVVSANSGSRMKTFTERVISSGL
ncbi:hypothetical protein SPI_07895 [Niveomyces insectorum RCEF 264]|uniref:Uncharacterized protein n=1 Tax=Niveomyces insectorum RCEF 264 TaxID=1081102 RepID=A0A167P4N0_9HYPO|nr:hypothetical protein SPI_07895 [Niveomyces insectorum RCEF 264]